MTCDGRASGDDGGGAANVGVGGGVTFMEIAEMRGGLH